MIRVLECWLGALSEIFHPIPIRNHLPHLRVLLGCNNAMLQQILAMMHNIWNSLIQIMRRVRTTRKMGDSVLFSDPHSMLNIK